MGQIRRVTDRGIAMGGDKIDADALFEAVGIPTDGYIEVEQNDAILRIKNKWPLVREILMSCVKPPENQSDKTT